METNCQLKSAPKKISNELKNLLLDNITDGRPDQIVCNKIGQKSASELSLSDSGCNSLASYTTLSSVSYSTLLPSSKKSQKDNDDYNIIISYKVLKTIIEENLCCKQCVEKKMHSKFAHFISWLEKYEKKNRFNYQTKKSSDTFNDENGILDATKYIET